MKNTMETLKELAEEIARADWSYDRSDDYGVYLRGRGQCEDITSKMKLMEFDGEDTFYLEKMILEPILNPKWSHEFTEEVCEYWSRKIERLTRK
jgi:hypothetical protein